MGNPIRKIGTEEKAFNLRGVQLREVFNLGGMTVSCVYDGFTYMG